MQPTLAFPSFFLGSPVGIASSSNSRFPLYFLGGLTTWQATRPRVSTAFLCSPVSTASSANARYHFVRCVSIFRLWTSCRRDKQYTQAFSSFFLEARVDLASSPHSRFHCFSCSACRFGEQFQLTFPSFFPGPLPPVAVTSTPHMRFHFSSLDLLFTRRCWWYLRRNEALFFISGEADSARELSCAFIPNPDQSFNT